MQQGLLWLKQYSRRPVLAGFDLGFDMLAAHGRLRSLFKCRDSEREKSAYNFSAWFYFSSLQVAALTQSCVDLKKLACSSFKEAVQQRTVTLTVSISDYLEHFR